MDIRAEYIWIDGSEPVSKLRSKTKVLKALELAPNTPHLLTPFLVSPPDHDMVPVWGFDGSSTNQAVGKTSDCVLVPVCTAKDPLREDSILVMCEVFDSNVNPHSTNNRAAVRSLEEKHASDDCWFGIEQEYTLFKGRSPLGWPEGGYPAPQGPFYCGIGADEVYGRQIAEEHLEACLSAGLKIAGINAEVMPGQWEFQIGPAGPLEVSDHLWLARYLLYRIAEGFGVTVKLDPKPIEGDWNGAGAHTNFSTKSMRASVDCMMVPLESSSIKSVGYKDESLFVEFNTGKVYKYPGAPRSAAQGMIHSESPGKYFNTKVKSEYAHVLIEGYDECEKAAQKLGDRFAREGFPKDYGFGFEKRLTGVHETCDHKKFRYGVADRTASVRIPLHVKSNGKGYIEDRRPCANIDPYSVVGYIMGTVCG